MYRPAARALLRSAGKSTFAPARTAAGRRFASSSPADARRSWKSSAARWGLAIAGIYYYNTSPVFAEQPQSNLLNPNLDALEDDDSENSSLEALTSRRARQAEKNASVLHSAVDAISSENSSTSVSAGQSDTPLELSGPAALEEEVNQQGAFNPETGEINWDCSCLGGMAYGPCGPEFREAFSCFVYSTEEPKGMDCIEKFQNMQGCFQKHPEVYKGELEDEEELDAEWEKEREELVQEIKERREKEKGREHGASQKRLLEEPDPQPRLVKAEKKEKETSETFVSEGESQLHTKEGKTLQEITSPEKEKITEG